jgi:hypothetical protein
MACSVSIGLVALATLSGIAGTGKQGRQAGRQVLNSLLGAAKRVLVPLRARLLLPDGALIRRQQPVGWCHARAEEDDQQCCPAHDGRYGVPRCIERLGPAMLEQVGGKGRHVERSDKQAEDQQKADQKQSPPGPMVSSGLAEALAGRSGIVIIRHGVPRR